MISLHHIGRGFFRASALRTTLTTPNTSKPRAVGEVKLAFCDH